MIDELTLQINGTTQLKGWLQIAVTRSLERLPSTFDVGLTERYTDGSLVVARAGDACEVFLGADRVVTGYINRYMPSFDKSSHSIRISGRSKSQDLVDCSAEWKGAQIIGSSALQIAQKLAHPYGITVTTDVDVGPVIPKFSFMIGETPFDIMERVCRFSGLLIYDKTDGSVLLTQTGKTRAASGFAQGINVQAASFVEADDQTFQEYDIYPLSVNSFEDAGITNQPLAKQPDPNVKRHRLRFFVAESGAAGYDLTLKRAKWEAARRHGRSWRVAVTTDSWRDSAGKLWEPNTLATVDLPKLNVNKLELCIGEVTYRLDERGTTADLVLMLPDAFRPEPINLLPIVREVIPAK